jgi:selenophosphate synthetase-related protein
MVMRGAAYLSECARAIKQRVELPLQAQCEPPDDFAQAYNVPIVGGHTNCHSPYNALAVAILGRATCLITSFNARPGDWLLVAIDRNGNLHPQHPFWNAATRATPEHLRNSLEILPQLAERGLCDAGKDISMGGIVGTALMLLETSGCGGLLDLDAISCPTGCALEKWLICFPSYGFLLSVRPEQVESVKTQFHRQGLHCEAIGQVHATPELSLKSGSESVRFWDLAHRSLTGFKPAADDSSTLR